MFSSDSRKTLDVISLDKKERDDTFNIYNREVVERFMRDKKICCDVSC